MTTDNKKNGDDKPTAVKKGRSKRFKRWMFALGATTALATGVVIEANTSYLQSKFFHSLAEGKTVSDPECKLVPPAVGPLDEDRGYTNILHFREQLKQNGYDITCGSWKDRSILGLRLIPIYEEKTQAGLKIEDPADKTSYLAQFPREAFTSYNSIPPILAKSLLFVEDRELLKDHPDEWNPAINPVRFGVAVGGQAMKKVGLRSERGSGGSTLATQLEKFRHSPRGITGSPKEKIRQMLTASTRAYVENTNTTESRRNIVTNYLDGMPLSSYPGFGSVYGYPDGMALWFGADYREASRLMMQDEANLNDAQLKEVAKAYRQSLNLVMSVRKPSDYLKENRDELNARVDMYLPLLADAGIISPRLRDATLAEKVVFADPQRADKVDTTPPPKSVQGMQVDLMKTLDVRGLYKLNRLDLTGKSTVFADVDAKTAAHLRSLADPAVAQASGLVGFQLLKPEMTGDVVYTFTLYEKTPDGRNVLRVQADNFDGPLNLNEGVKLELGSTAKLRTLVSYLEAVAELHDKFEKLDTAAIKATSALPQDHITRWAVDYMTGTDTDKTLNGMLEAALNRTYSGNPAEVFFTAGGAHRFENFEKNESGNYTVKDAFHHSVNLSFVRIMRDVMYYSMSQKMHVDPAIFEDNDSPARQAYLQKFADMEGRGFMWKFWGEQKDKSPDELATLLASKTHHSAVQLAVVYRSLFPEKPVADMEAFIRKECKDCGDNTDFQGLYDKYARDKFDLNDRGYITSIHPLALWMAESRIKSPDQTWEQTAAASTDTRQEVYKWLFKDGKEHGQNLRIQTMLEKEAFTYIHKDWKSLGYPFSTLVASYASAIGVSGDTPAALAELSGIIQNDGVRKLAIKFTEIEIGKGTPYETIATPKPTPGTRVLPEEVAKLVRREMNGVVDEGTAKRAHNSVTLSDGRILPVGGKTGTGDNRLQTFSARGGVTSSEAKSRTATFVFAIDDRFYGCVTAYVMGPDAAQYKFTSALAAQVFKTVAPDIRPVLDRAYGVTPPAKPTPQKAVKAETPSPVKPS